MRRRQIASAALGLACVLAMASGFGALPVLGANVAAPLAQPSERPPLDLTATWQAATAAAQPPPQQPQPTSPAPTEIAPTEIVTPTATSTSTRVYVPPTRTHTLTPTPMPSATPTRLLTSTPDANATAVIVLATKAAAAETLAAAVQTRAAATLTAIPPTDSSAYATIQAALSMVAAAETLVAANNQPAPTASPTATQQAASTIGANVLTWPVCGGALALAGLGVLVWLWRRRYPAQGRPFRGALRPGRKRTPPAQLL